MKLTRTVHTAVRVFYGPAGELLPDIQPVIDHDEPDYEQAVADRCLLFVDEGAGEAHAFLFTDAQVRELAGQLAPSPLEIVRTMPTRPAAS